MGKDFAFVRFNEQDTLFTPTDAIEFRVLSEVYAFKPE